MVDGVYADWMKHAFNVRDANGRLIDPVTFWSDTIASLNALGLWGPRLMWYLGYWVHEQIAVGGVVPMNAQLGLADIARLDNLRNVRGIYVPKIFDTPWGMFHVLHIRPQGHAILNDDQGVWHVAEAHEGLYDSQYHFQHRDNFRLRDAPYLPASLFIGTIQEYCEQFRLMRVNPQHQIPIVARVEHMARRHIAEVNQEKICCHFDSYWYYAQFALRDWAAFENARHYITGMEFHATPGTAYWLPACEGQFSVSLSQEVSMRTSCNTGVYSHPNVRLCH